MPRRAKPTPTITRAGREFVDAATFKNLYNYTDMELITARNAGLPFITAKWGLKSVYYYNLEDCEAWHRGEKTNLAR